MPNNVLENMKNIDTLQVDTLTAAGDMMTTQLARVTEEVTAMIGVLDLRAGEMVARLEIKKIELDGDEIIYGPTFNAHALPPAGNITDWHIDSTAGVIYSFVPPINWDSDDIIIGLSTKWNWTSNYLYQPPGLSGSFGLVAKQSQLTTSIGVNTANKTQISQTSSMLP